MNLLPNAELAIVPLEKLTGYVLNPMHPVGKHKASIFKRKLDLTVSNAVFLQEKIQSATLFNEAFQTYSDHFGQRFRMEFELEHNGYSAIVVTAWILEHHEISPRLITCYIK